MRKAGQVEGADQGAKDYPSTSFRGREKEKKEKNLEGEQGSQHTLAHSQIILCVFVCMFVPGSMLSRRCVTLPLKSVLK